MNNRCVLCGGMGTVRWTIDNGDVAVVTHLCAKDSAPLMEVVKKAGPLPPSRKQDSLEPEVPRRQPRRRDMSPLVDWTPPSDPPLLTE